MASSTEEITTGQEARNQELMRMQGKVAELRQELSNSGKKDKNHAAKKNALKKIIANMTMSNNDMVALFPDVLACMSIENLEVKKMYESSRLQFKRLTPSFRCFLYLQNYARQKPDVAIRALPILQEVCQHSVLMTTLTSIRTC